MTLLPDGKILAAAGGGVARLLGTNTNVLYRPPFDFDGDGKSDVSIFRPNTGIWYLLRSQAGFAALQFGIASDRLAPADFDGDGKTDVAVFRNGLWYLLRSTAGFTTTEFGLSGDIPVPGDWDGDGKAEVAVYRESTGGGQSFFYYRGTLNNPNNNITFIPFGLQGDKPVFGDFDGDGKQDAAVYRPSNGGWYLLDSSGGFRVYQFGNATDKLVPADYDGDGKTDLGVFRNGIWFRLQSTRGFEQFNFGVAGDIPAVGDYDGDGKADVTVFRNQTGIWYIGQSLSGSVLVFQFGQSGDFPIPSAFSYN
jgi:hypothetical protein